jgi:hypothetical protein
MLTGVGNPVAGALLRSLWRSPGAGIDRNSRRADPGAPRGGGRAEGLAGS